MLLSQSVTGPLGTAGVGAPGEQGGETLPATRRPAGPLGKWAPLCHLLPPTWPQGPSHCPPPHLALWGLLPAAHSTPTHPRDLWI